MNKITIIKANDINANSTSPGAHRISLAEGFEKLGVQVEFCPITSRPRTEHVACWGWRQGKSLKQRGHKVLVLERGYIGDRFNYTSLGWNGLNGYASFPFYPYDDGKRFLIHNGGEMKPWKKGGEYILILGQVIGDASLQGRNIGEWYLQKAKEVSDIYGLPVYFRPHPCAAARGGYLKINGFQNLGGSLQDALSDALFTIAFNSNSCLDSIIQGIPCLAGDKGTMAWGLCMQNPYEIIRPERESLVHQIAWTQWTPDEMREGIPQRKLIEIAP